MEAKQIQFTRLLGEKVRFNIPVYQRNYEWKKEQCEQLFEDIQQVYKNKKSNHFIGTIVYIGENSFKMSVNDLVVIDGQQRLTTVVILLKALYDVLDDEEFKEELLNSYFINRYVKEENKKLKLKPMKTDNKVFKQLMNNEEILEKESNLYRNYELFKKLILDSKLKAIEIYEGINKLSIVYIELEREKDDPQLIFESINSTGLSLNEGDLIRNFMLMDKAIEEQERFYREYWKKLEVKLGTANISNFVRDYLTMKTGSIPKKDMVYQTFKKHIKERYEETEKAEFILEELCFYGEFYGVLIKLNSKEENINIVLKKLKKLKQTVTYPFLMYIFEKHYYKFISTEEFIRIIKLIETYIFRRSICEIATNALNKIFANLIKEIEEFKNYEKNYYECIASILMSKQNSGIFPSDAYFKEKFIQRNMYKFNGLKYMLEEIENSCSKEKIITNYLTIEHIMPQKLTPHWQIELGNKSKEIHEKYLHNIGNLTLTGYNGELSNKKFSEKKKLIQENSKLHLNSFFINSERWDKESIIKRSEELYLKALENWKLPEISNQYLENNKYLEKEYFTLEDEFNVTGRVPLSIQIDKEKFSVKSWREMWVKVCEFLYNLDSIKFLELTEDLDFKGKKNRIITLNKDECREGELIGDRIIIEKNLNANAILNYIKIINEKYEIVEDFIYWLR